MDVQRNLEASVEKRMKDTYGPPPGLSFHVLGEEQLSHLQLTVKMGSYVQ